MIIHIYINKILSIVNILCGLRKNLFNFKTHSFFIKIISFYFSLKWKHFQISYLNTLNSIIIRRVTTIIWKTKLNCRYLWKTLHRDGLNISIQRWIIRQYRKWLSEEESSTDSFTRVWKSWVWNIDYQQNFIYLHMNDQDVT